METVTEYIDSAIAQAKELRTAATNEGNPEATRELALGITSLEDAKLRFFRGLAMRHGVAATLDLQKQDQVERWTELVGHIDQEVREEAYAEGREPVAAGGTPGGDPSPQGPGASER